MAEKKELITYDDLKIELKPEQLRYAFLKANSNLSQRQIAEQLEVHYNTLTNWNKNDLVQKAIQYEVEEVKRDNALKIQQLMKSMLTEAISILSDKDTSNGVKTQMIGQLFNSVGKYAGLEPTKKVQKDINVNKTFEQLIMDADIEEADIIEDEICLD